MSLTTLVVSRRPRRRSGQDVFDILSAYFEKWNLSGNSCIGICTDGAPCIVGSIKGFVSLLQKENPNVVQPTASSIVKYLFQKQYLMT